MNDDALMNTMNPTGRADPAETTPAGPLWDALALYPAELDPATAALMSEPLPRRQPGWRSGWAAAAMALLVVGALVWRPWLAEAPAMTVYRSGPEERLVLNLADGSTVHLNANSRVAIALDERTRRVVLERGQALFRVAHEPGRRFMVQTSNGAAEALGTVFDVAVAGGRVTVTVAEGRVRVSTPARTPGRDVALIAEGNQQIVVDERGRLSNRRIDDLQPILAWVDGKLVFRGEPLADAVDRLNRLNAEQVELASREIGALPVYGVFNIGDTDGFVVALEAAYGLRSEPMDDGRTLLGTRIPAD